MGQFLNILSLKPQSQRTKAQVTPSIWGMEFKPETLTNVWLYHYYSTINPRVQDFFCIC